MQLQQAGSCPQHTEDPCIGPNDVLETRVRAGACGPERITSLTVCLSARVTVHDRAYCSCTLLRDWECSTLQSTLKASLD